jgi:hypothetical protein
MKAGSTAMKSDQASAKAGARPLPQKVQELLARANYEPPKVISNPTSALSKLTPVTMMANL